MSILGFILADLAFGSVLQEQENTQEEVDKLRKEVEKLRAQLGGEE